MPYVRTEPRTPEIILHLDRGRAFFVSCGLICARRSRRHRPPLIGGLRPTLVWKLQVHRPMVDEMTMLVTAPRGSRISTLRRASDASTGVWIAYSMIASLLAAYLVFLVLRHGQGRSTLVDGWGVDLV